MNKALPHITGQWVYFLGSGDESLPEFRLWLMNWGMQAQFITAMFWLMGKAVGVNNAVLYGKGRYLSPGNNLSAFCY